MKIWENAACEVDILNGYITSKSEYFYWIVEHPFCREHCSDKEILFLGFDFVYLDIF